MKENQYSSFFPIFSKTLLLLVFALAVYFYGFNQAKLTHLKKQFVNFINLYLINGTSMNFITKYLLNLFIIW
jgi:hypothetical protein